MGQLIGVSLGGPYAGIIIAVIIVAVVVPIRIYSMKNSRMRAKCPKCDNVFDASGSFSLFHLGSEKLLKCPACGKTSLMNAYVKDAVTWPPKEQNSKQQIGNQVIEEEFEKKRIEDPKYGRS